MIDNDDSQMASLDKVTRLERPTGQKEEGMEHKPDIKTEDAEFAAFLKTEQGMKYTKWFFDHESKLESEVKIKDARIRELESRIKDMYEEMAGLMKIHHAQDERVVMAIADKIWQDHKLGDKYTMDGKPDHWKIAYYPIFENGKTKEVYEEPRALVEKPLTGGTDFREVPLRYLTKVQTETNTKVADLEADKDSFAIGFGKFITTGYDIEKFFEEYKKTTLK